MINTKAIVDYMQRAEVTKSMLAEQLDMNLMTLDNKINNQEGEIFTVKEANTIAKVLSILCDLLMEFFWGVKVLRKSNNEGNNNTNEKNMCFFRNYTLFSYNPETKNGVVVLTTGASGACDEYGIYSVCGEVTEVLYGAANQLM